MRYIYLTVLFVLLETSFVSSHLRGLQDFEWGVEPVDGYPQINFNAESQGSNGELLFQYAYEGQLSDSKYLSYRVLQYDCIGSSDGGVFVANPDIEIPGIFQFNVNVNQENVTKSIHYSDLDSTTSFVSFCMRLDYVFVDWLGTVESINFHETKFTVTIDRTAGFNITNIDLERLLADEVDCETSVEYDVEAYFCDELSNAVIEDPQPLTQGDFMQVCIRLMNEAGNNDEVFIEDILSFIITQPLGPGRPSVPILNTQADALTTKRCVNQKCNVKTQLKSEYFVFNDPNDLQVDGSVILGFGGPDVAGASRRSLNSGDVSSSPCTCHEPLVTGTQGVASHLEFPIEVVEISNEEDVYVTFQVHQRWKEEDSISWLATEYKTKEGVMVCHKRESVSWELNDAASAMYTSQCVNGWAEVTLYVHDGSFSRTDDDAVVPAYCEPSRDQGRKISMTVQLPCGCYTSAYGVTPLEHCWNGGATSSSTSTSATTTPSPVVVTTIPPHLVSNPQQPHPSACHKRRHRALRMKWKSSSLSSFDRRALQLSDTANETTSSSSSFQLVSIPLNRLDAHQKSAIEEGTIWVYLVTILRVQPIVAGCTIGIVVILVVVCGRRRRRRYLEQEIQVCIRHSDCVNNNEFIKGNNDVV